MRFFRRSPGLAVAVLLFGGACAGPTSSRRGDGQPPAQASPDSGTAGVTPLSRPSGPNINSEEDADLLRRELDALGDDSPERLRRRQQLLDYYVSSAKTALDRDQPEEAYQTFEQALTLFEARELQDPSRPPDGQVLFPIAERLDRVYSRRGAHAQVTTAMMVQLSLHPQDPGLLRRYAQLRDWLNGQSEGVRNLLRGRGSSLQDLLATPPATMSSDLEQTYRVWPAVGVRQELLTIYRAEAASVMAGGKRSPKDFLQSLSSSLRRKGLTNGPAFKVARLYLRASRPEESLAAMKQLGPLSAEDSKLQEVLEGAFARPAGGEEGRDKLLAAIKLAMALAQNPEDAEVSLQLCRDLATRAPKLVAAQMCVGELAIALERKGLALRAFERARALGPGERSVWDMVGRLYVDRLSDLVVDERTSDLETALGQVEAFYQSMRQQFPESPPTAGMAAALAEVGRGYFNAGRIVEAVRYLERSNSVEPNAVALEQLGVLHLRRGEFGPAAATLERARAIFMANQQADPVARMLFFARMGRLIAEAIEAQPDGKAAAAEARQKTLRQFEQLIDSNRLASSRIAEAEVERGKLLYQSGERETALEALRRAADLAASSSEDQGRAQAQVYVDMLAFLVPRGELDESVSMYHRALGRVRLPESMKVYCSLWVNDLLVRAGQLTDPLADGLLRSMQGGKWHAELARWASGRLTEPELLLRADTQGKQAEANFYLAMAQLRAGNRPEAEQRWRKVLSTQMLGYFEYEMSNLYLKQGGAPMAPLVPAPTPPTPRRPLPTTPPAGSI